MSNADKIMLECTSCGRKKCVPREPNDPPGLALMQTQCNRCSRGHFSPEFYFDAQGHEINCDGELLPPRLMRREMAIVAMFIIAAGLLVFSVVI
ncbi:MAG: hypothetical protein ACKVP3_14005 [Hyphomicrobiaceae bacterium]